MNLMETESVEEMMVNALDKSMSYEDYLELVGNLVENGSTTGNEITSALINYTALNNRRMKRWDKTLKISESDLEFISGLKTNMTWLVLTESWCGDAAHILPILNLLAGSNTNIELRIVLRDDNDDLMNMFLTDGNRSIPKLIMLDSRSNEVVATYGPRPSVATQMVKDYKNTHGKLTPEFKEDLQRWYNKDKGQTTIRDIIKILKSN